MDPGPYHGDYTEGKSFPVYVSASWCGKNNGGDGEWYIDYDLYYVQDGNLSAGHRNDWEGVTVVFRRAPKAGKRDWWSAQGIIYRRHSSKDYYDRKDVMSVAGKGDIEDERFDNNKGHPKVFVGFFSHSAYRKKADSGNGGTPTNTGAGASEHEYRSSDWYRLPAVKDFRLYSDIKEGWTYGSADSTPSANKKKMCTWNVEGGHLSGGW